MKKGLQAVKNRKNMSAEKIAAADKADAAELLERQVIAAEALVEETRRLADNAERMANTNAQIMGCCLRLANEMEGLRDRYETVVSSLKRLYNSWLICGSTATC